MGAILAFKFQNLFQSAHQHVHRADIAFAGGGGDRLADFVNFAFKLCKPLLQQVLEALDGGAGAVFPCAGAKLPAAPQGLGNQFRPVDAQAIRY